MGESMDQKEAFRRRNRERLKRLKLLDDDFFRVCFADDLEGAAFILRILVGKKDLKVTHSLTQYSIKNLQGHSIVLDVYARDSSGRIYNIEIQRETRGAVPQRARYNSSLLDAKHLIPSDEFVNLPETYVIFITEKDVLGKGRPIYHIDRMIRETEEEFGDGTHILYVNASTQDDSEIGRLMHDFNCTEPDEMNYAYLAEKTKLFKYDEKGESKMCEIWEEVKAEGREEGRAEGRAEGREEGRAEGREEGRAEGRQEGLKKGIEQGEKRAAEQAKLRELAVKFALQMIRDGHPVEKISSNTGLTVEEVNEYVSILVG